MGVVLSNKICGQYAGGCGDKDGYISSVDDPVTDYLPRLKGGVYEGVNIGQLLQMSSGVGWNEDYTDPNANVAVALSEALHLFRYMNQLPPAENQALFLTTALGKRTLLDRCCAPRSATI